MKNNRGWGLESMLWLLAGILVFFAIAVFLINQFIKSINENEDLKQEDLVEVKVPVAEIKKADEVEKETTIKKDESITSLTPDELENKLVESGRKYISAYYEAGIDDGVTLNVTVVKLKQDNMLDSLMYENKECSGYLSISFINNEITYKPYISCGEVYKTTNYVELLDNLDL